MEKGVKTSKLAIISFILSIIIIISFPNFLNIYHLDFRSANYFSVISFLLLIINLPLSIVSLVRVKSKNMKGKFYAYFSLIVTIVFLLIIFILWTWNLSHPSAGSWGG